MFLYGFSRVIVDIFDKVCYNGRSRAGGFPWYILKGGDCLEKTIEVIIRISKYSLLVSDYCKRSISSDFSGERGVCSVVRVGVH